MNIKPPTGQPYLKTMSINRGVPTKWHYEPNDGRSVYADCRRLEIDYTVAIEGGGYHNRPRTCGVLVNQEGAEKLQKYRLTKQQRKPRAEPTPEGQERYRIRKERREARIAEAFAQEFPGWRFEVDGTTVKVLRPNGSEYGAFQFSREDLRKTPYELVTPHLFDGRRQKLARVISSPYCEEREKELERIEHEIREREIIRRQEEDLRRQLPSKCDADRICRSWHWFADGRYFRDNNDRSKILCWDGRSFLESREPVAFDYFDREQWSELFRLF